MLNIVISQFTDYVENKTQSTGKFRLASIKFGNTIFVNIKSNFTCIYNYLFFKLFLASMPSTSFSDPHKGERELQPVF